MQGLSGSRKARNSIPKVDQNPRLQQAKPLGPKPTYHAGLATRVATTATTTAQPTNASVPATQSQATDPFKAAGPATTQGGGGLFPIPSYRPQPGQDDPRDSTYWANVSKLKFNAETEYGKELSAQTRADTDYGDAVQTAIRNRVGQQRNLGEDAIRSNLGNSGWLNRNEAEQTSAYTQERAHAQLNKTEEDAARAAARAALQQGYGVDTAAELAEAGGRYIQRKREEAQNGAGETVAPVAAAPAGPAPEGRYAGAGKNTYGVSAGTALGHHPIPAPAIVHRSPISPVHQALSQNQPANKKKRK